MSSPFRQGPALDPADHDPERLQSGVASDRPGRRHLRQDAQPQPVRRGPLQISRKVPSATTSSSRPGRPTSRSTTPASPARAGRWSSSSRPTSRTTSRPLPPRGRCACAAPPQASRRDPAGYAPCRCSRTRPITACSSRSTGRRAPSPRPTTPTSSTRPSADQPQGPLRPRPALPDLAGRRVDLRLRASPAPAGKWSSSSRPTSRITSHLDRVRQHPLPLSPSSVSEATPAANEARHREVPGYRRRQQSCDPRRVLREPGSPVLAEHPVPLATPGVP